MHILPPLDVAALAFFLLAWGGYAIAVEWGPGSGTGLNARMHDYRDIWMRRALDRELRMFDAQIMAALQNGTAFFASTSLLAIGGGLTMLRATNEIHERDRESAGRRAADLGEVGDQGGGPDPHPGLCVLQVRLGVSALQLRRDHARRDAAGERAHHGGSRTPRAAHDQALRVPRAGTSTAASARSSSRSATSAGSPGPWPLIVSTTAIVVVMWRRQFASAAQRALTAEVPEKVPAEGRPETAPTISP